MLSNKLTLSPKLELQQKITQQQILRAELLQIPLLELMQRVDLELNQNPMLELLDPGETSQDVESVDDRVGLPDIPDIDPSTEESASVYQDRMLAEPVESMPADQPLTELPQQEKQSEIDWERVFGDDDMSSPRIPGGMDWSDEEDRPIEYRAEIGFTDALYEQVHLDAHLSDIDREIAEFIIGSLHPSGYLDADIVHYVSNKLDVEIEDVTRILSVLQGYDPPGIFARSLQESLHLQLRRKLEDTPTHHAKHAILLLSLHIVDEAFEHLTNRRFELLKNQFSIDDDALREVFSIIQMLQPSPGVGKEGGEYITPELIVTRELRDGVPPGRVIDLPNQKRLYIYLSDGVVPELKISKRYRSMFQDKAIDPATRQWLEQRFESARNFVKAVQSRQHTMLDVMEQIVLFQQEFFLSGGKQVPLTQLQVADHAGCDNSTVSRAIKDKYVDTDFGTFPLKYFFGGSLETDFGGDVSTREIKQKLAELIESEDKKSPLTDQALCDAMNRLGYKLARRTVQKYREQLSYPLARFRRIV